MLDPQKRERGTEESREYGGEGREMTKLEMVVDLVQTVFRDRVLAEEATWQAVVLIFKGMGLLPWHKSCGGGMEGGGGDSKSPIHYLHHLLQLPPWVPGRLRYGDRHPQNKTSPEGYGYEGGGTPHNIPGPAQGI